MNNVKTKIKELAGEALLRTGLWNRLLQTWARRHEAIILTYHRVIEKWDRTLDYSQPGMVVTVKTFDRQLAFLKKHFHIVPLSSFINFSPNTQQQKPDRPLCAVTFDDGWRDNYEISFPILRKHDVPATVFLTTDFIGTDRAFWHSELIYLLMHGDLSSLARHHGVFKSYPTPVRSRLRRLARVRRPLSAHDVNTCIETVKTPCDENIIEGLIRDLANAVGLRRPLFPERRLFLDWDQVCEMAAAGIEIGSHGCSHGILTRLNAVEAEEELVRSMAAIEEHIGQTVQHFAFPDGAWNRNLMVLVRKAGYRTACLCASGPDEGRSLPVLLRRVGMHEGVSAGVDGSFSKAALLLWLSRAPRTRPTLVPLKT